MTRRELTVVAAAACAACCVGPLVAVLGGLGVLGLASTFFIGVAGLIVAGLATTGFLVLRHRR